MFICIHCNKSFINKGGLGAHQPSCKSNPERINRKRSPNAGAKKGCITWNKGLKTSDEVKNKISSSLKGKSKGTASSPEKENLRKQKISATMKANPNSGGLRKNSGRGKKGNYQNIWCDSTWELAWVIYHIEHNIEFERNWKGFEYDYNNQKYKYYPDFKIGNTYIEVKGRKNYEKLSDKDKVKITKFKDNLIVLYEPQMKPILTYVISKYGKDFYHMYEDTIK